MELHQTYGMACRRDWTAHGRGRYTGERRVTTGLLCLLSGRVRASSDQRSEQLLWHESQGRLVRFRYCAAGGSCEYLGRASDRYVVGQADQLWREQGRRYRRIGVRSRWADRLLLERRWQPGSLEHEPRRLGAEAPDLQRALAGGLTRRSLRGLHLLADGRKLCLEDGSGWRLSQAAE